MSGLVAPDMIGLRALYRAGLVLEAVAVTVSVGLS